MENLSVRLYNSNVRKPICDLFDCEGRDLI